jgi:hypothetical protein
MAYDAPMFFSDNAPVYLFIHLRGQLMQFALRNEIQERISANYSNYLFLQKNVCNVILKQQYYIGMANLY